MDDDVVLPRGFLGPFLLTSPSATACALAAPAHRTPLARRVAR